MVDAYRFIDTCTRADHIDISKFCLRNSKHALDLLPISNICLLKNCHGGGPRLVGMICDELMRLRAKGKVGKEDVAMFSKERFGEGEVYSWSVGQDFEDNWKPREDYQSQLR